MATLLALLVLANVANSALGVSAAQSGPDPALTLLLATDRPAYRQGETASVTIAVDNAGQSAVPVRFSSAQRYDVVAFAGDREIWRWSADRSFAQVESEAQFPPGLTLLGRIAWDWRDATGAPLAPGSYRLIGMLSGAPSVTGNTLLIDLSAP